MIKQSLSVMAASFVLATGAALPTQAQQSQGGMAPPAGQQQVQVSEDQLEKFAEATDEIADIREEYQEKLNSAGSQEKAQSLQGEASEEMMGAIESAGMTVAEYNQIASAVQMDPNLRSRLTEMR